MKKLIFLLLLATFLGPRLACADDFYKEGIWIAFPGDFKEEKLGLEREGHARYRVKQKDPAQPSRTLVETFIQVDKSDAYQQYGAEEGAESCLGLLMERVGRQNIRQLTFPKKLQLSGSLAMSFTMIHPGRYATNTWEAELVNSTIYCIVEPAREVVITVLAPADTPQELFANTLKSIESLKFVSK
ncbi:hypothetical protein ACO0LC_26080 [Undibacterium sp. JH2W]|uniref:hypothetical protein n=1 Tax=Undibacterium sp. JH2W TaxID=3413037 RepID=UPI003BF399F0